MSQSFMNERKDRCVGVFRLPWDEMSSREKVKTADRTMRNALLPVEETAAKAL